MGHSTREINLHDVIKLKGEVTCTSNDLKQYCGYQMQVGDLYTSLALHSAEEIEVQLSDHGCVYLSQGRYPSQSFAEIEVGQEISNRLW